MLRGFAPARERVRLRMRKVYHSKDNFSYDPIHSLWLAQGLFYIVFRVWNFRCMISGTSSSAAFLPLTFSYWFAAYLNILFL